MTIIGGIMVAVCLVLLFVFVQRAMNSAFKRRVLRIARACSPRDDAALVED